MTTEPLNRHLVAEGSVNFNYKFSEDKTTLTVDGVEYTKGADGKYTRTEKVGNKTTTYTVTVNEEELKDDDTIKAMLAKEFHIDASKITLKDGKTYVLHGFPFEDIKEGTVLLEDDIAYITYTSVSTKEKIDTKEAERATKEAENGEISVQTEEKPASAAEVVTEEPTYEEPSYEEPSYEEPSYEEPSYEEPAAP